MITSVLRRLCVLSFVGVFAACDGESISTPAAETRHAVAAQSCAPNDAPAVAIYLTPTPVNQLEPPPPYFRVDIWRHAEQLQARTWVLHGNGADGAARYRPNATSFHVATAGTVTVHSVSADRTVRGTVDLSFASGIRVRRTFEALWLPSEILCG